MVRALLDNPVDHWALVHRTDAENEGLAIFVHGFRGKYLDTWGALAQVLLEDRYNSAYRPILEPWDFLFVGYDTKKIDTYLDIAALVHTEWRRARSGAQPYGHARKRLALFAHSLGTLATRQVLCAAAKYDHDLLASLKAAARSK